MLCRGTVHGNNSVHLSMKILGFPSYPRRPGDLKISNPKSFRGFRENRDMKRLEYDMT